MTTACLAEEDGYQPDCDGERCDEIDVLEIGDTLKVPDWIQVSILERTIPTEGDNRWPLEPGDTCHIAYQGEVEILDFIDDRALLVYSPSPIHGGCRPGAKFEFPSAELATFRSKYEKHVEEEAIFREEIRDILSGRSQIHSVETLTQGDVLQVGDYELVLDIYGVYTTREIIRAGVECGSEEGSSVEILGFLSDEQHALVEQTSTGPDGPTAVSCRTGGRFVLPVSSLLTW